jgi:hypothetical protein
MSSEIAIGAAMMPKANILVGQKKGKGKRHENNIKEDLLRISIKRKGTCKKRSKRFLPLFLFL